MEFNKGDKVIGIGTCEGKDIDGKTGIIYAERSLVWRVGDS